MVAVLVPTSSAQPQHDLVERPSLRIITGGRSRQIHVASVRSHPSAAVFRRRRILAALAVITVVTLAVLLLVNVASLLGGRSATAVPVTSASAAALGSTDLVSSATYVVKPGDTLWAIAHRLQPQGDVRGLVDELADRQGGAALQAGQRIDLSGLVD